MTTNIANGIWMTDDSTIATSSDGGNLGTYDFTNSGKAEGTNWVRFIRCPGFMFQDETEMNVRALSGGKQYKMVLGKRKGQNQVTEILGEDASAVLGYYKTFKQLHAIAGSMTLYLVNCVASGVYEPFPDSTGTLHNYLKCVLSSIQSQWDLEKQTWAVKAIIELCWDG